MKEYSSLIQSMLMLLWLTPLKMDCWRQISLLIQKRLITQFLELNKRDNLVNQSDKNMLLIWPNKTKQSITKLIIKLLLIQIMKLIMKEEPLLMFTLLSWSVSQLTKQSTTKTIYNSKFLSTAETMLFTLEQFGWDHLLPNQPELFSTQVQNTLLSPLFFVMMKLQETISSRSTILFRVASSKEIKCTEDARQWLTTCTSPNQIRFFQKQAQSWPMVQPNFKVSSGKITHASKHWKVVHNQVFNWNLSLNKTNVHSSNFWVCINHKVSVMTPMVSLDSHHTKTWKRRSSIICGHWRTMALLIELW